MVHDRTMLGNNEFPIFAAPLDIADIDRYLIQLLAPHAHSFSRSIGVLFTKTSMIALLDAFLVCATMASTPGALALGLRACKKSVKHVYLYAFLKSILPAIYQRFVSWHQRNFLECENINLRCLERRAFERKRRFFQKVIDFIGRVDPIIRASLLIAWWNGSLSAPTASLLTSGIYFSGVTNPKAINISYAHRRWLYDLIYCSFTLSSPVNGVRDLMAIMNTNFVTPFWQLSQHFFSHRKFDNQCGICNLQPVIVPWYCSCNHLYCYTCIWIEMGKGSIICCRNCGNQIKDIHNYKNGKTCRTNEIET
jgi:hypothetical protein